MDDDRIVFTCYDQHGNVVGRRITSRSDQARIERENARLSRFQRRCWLVVTLLFLTIAALSLQALLQRAPPNKAPAAPTAR